jgi:hypothetical protein
MHRTPHKWTLQREQNIMTIRRPTLVGTIGDLTQTLLRQLCSAIEKPRARTRTWAGFSGLMLVALRLRLKQLLADIRPGSYEDKAMNSRNTLYRFRFSIVLSCFYLLFRQGCRHSHNPYNRALGPIEHQWRSNIVGAETRLQRQIFLDQYD